jgi:CRISPR/Cas system-associated exonuclease Cas4 (RecB family)
MKVSVLKVCMDDAVKRVGVLARSKAPPVVPASALGTWYWCRLKAWHNTTLFNTGWLSPEDLGEEEFRGLAFLWAAELVKRANMRIIIGKLIHGEPIASVLEEASDYTLALKLLREGAKAAKELLGSRLPYGLIEPAKFEEQLKRYQNTSDIVEYFQSEEWPLIARDAGSFIVIGVPDSIEMIDGAVRVVELKTTSKPRRNLTHSITFKAALAQLSTYAWILVRRWPVEEAVLVFKDHTGKLLLRKVYDAEELANYFEEKLRHAAAELASTQPPEPQDKPPCRSCEYNFEKLKSINQTVSKE